MYNNLYCLHCFLQNNYPLKYNIYLIYINKKCVVYCGLVLTNYVWLKLGFCCYLKVCKHPDRHRFKTIFWGGSGSTKRYITWVMSTQVIKCRQNNTFYYVYRERDRD